MSKAFLFPTDDDNPFDAFSFEEPVEHSGDLRVFHKIFGSHKQSCQCKSCPKRPDASEMEESEELDEHGEPLHRYPDTEKD